MHISILLLTLAASLAVAATTPPSTDKASTGVFTNANQAEALIEVHCGKAPADQVAKCSEYAKTSPDCMLPHGTFGTCPDMIKEWIKDASVGTPKKVEKAWWA